MQKLLSRTKSRFNTQLLVEVICYAFVIQFIYAGLYKILDFQVFILSLKQSPVISPIVGILAYVVPYGEIVVAAMLLVRKSRFFGLFIATVLWLDLRYILGIC